MQQTESTPDAGRTHTAYAVLTQAKRQLTAILPTDGFRAHVETVGDANGPMRHVLTSLYPAAATAARRIQQRQTKEPLRNMNGARGKVLLSTNNGDHLYGLRQQEQRLLAGLYSWHTENAEGNHSRLFPLPLGPDIMDNAGWMIKGAKAAPRTHRLVTRARRGTARKTG
eukprot:scaffold21153_cov33-Phaeocystis_antarctica.AAC.2